MSVKPEDIACVDIYPPINVARVGVYAFDKDSKPLGEITNDDYSLSWKVHVANKKAAWITHRSRFKFVKEVGRDDLRNPDVQGLPEGQKKPYEYTNTRTELIIDPGEKVVEGANVKDVFLDGQFGNDKEIPLHKDVRLGELRTDEKGRLFVLASDGKSFPASGNPDEMLQNGFDNAGWVDKVCDGTVRVTVKSKSQPELDIPVRNRATVMTAPPRFSSGTHAPTTLYELMEEIYERRRRREAGSEYKVGEVIYYRDIYPLFKRIYLLSWTNNRPKMNQRHGPRNMKLYFDNPELADPSPSSKDARADVFDKLRAPVIDGDKKNEKTRDDQAEGGHMPPLAGDAGDPVPGERDSWASLTQLQWHRFKKWSEGDFEPGNKEDQKSYESFDKIPLDEQPSALTKAALEWTIGAALYPGIECFWIAESEEMYKPAKRDEPWNRFRFADTVTPGDLSKGLCLPWQSDFNMCSTHWWPSVRPDDVVTEVYFNQVKRDTQPDQLATKLTQRVKWHRGIEGENRNERNTNMVRNWNKLGFIARQLYETAPDQLEIHIERQRHPDMPA